MSELQLSMFFRNRDGLCSTSLPELRGVIEYLGKFVHFSSTCEVIVVFENDVQNMRCFFLITNLAK